MCSTVSKHNTSHATEICTIKVLPSDHLILSAKRATEINPGNATIPITVQRALRDIVLPPEHIALLTGKYWGKGGVRLTVGFLDSPPSDLRSRILSHMNAWATTANVQFVESADNPDVRIARTPGDGYWSYLGTDILSIDQDRPTMNLESFTMETPDSEFYRVVKWTHQSRHSAW